MFYPPIVYLHRQISQPHGHAQVNQVRVKKIYIFLNNNHKTIKMNTLTKALKFPPRNSQKSQVLSSRAGTTKQISLSPPPITIGAIGARKRQGGATNYFESLTRT